ncbi:MAG: hypothetical protein IPJ49_16160 [Candidatus Obscuribacter sp.]|nr:hypothetical protein [Candidatus Obscuribacter sp.]
MGDKNTGDKSGIAAKDKAADKNTDTPSVKSSELMDKSALPILQQQHAREQSSTQSRNV